MHYRRSPVKIHTFIADDHALFREGLKALIKDESDMEVVGEAGDGIAAVEQVEKLRPHLVIMDICMPGLNGIEATRKILNSRPDTFIIGLSGHTNEEYVREMLAAGGHAYILKSRTFEELIRAIREVIQGRKYLSPDIARTVVDSYVELSQESNENPAFILLTDREREVLQQVAEGHTTKEIADHLDVSDKTIDSHRSNLMEKLDIHNVADLTKYAIRAGLTTLDE